MRQKLVQDAAVAVHLWCIYLPARRCRAAATDKKWFETGDAVLEPAVQVRRDGGLNSERNSCTYVRRYLD